MNKADKILTRFDEFLGGKIFGSIYLSTRDQESLYWVNPSSNELDNLAKQHNIKAVRFTADGKDKRVYVWDANFSLHFEVKEQVIKGYKQSDDLKRYFDGVAKPIGGKWTVFYSDRMKDVINDLDKYDKTWYQTDWSFIEKKSGIVGVEVFFDKVFTPKMKKARAKAVNLMT